ncbi:MAG: hypothetical protein P8X70_02200 [Nanoarchaeota archaeon]
MKIKKTFKKISGEWWFFIITIAIYLFILMIKPSLFFSSANFLIEISIQIIHIFIFVFFLMVITNYFITPKFILKNFKAKGIKKWFFMILGGMLSMGPAYVWYPFLSDLKNKGLNYGLIACFLYNRGIKIPLLPIAIFYFGWNYIIVLSLVMIFLSIIQGLLMNKILTIKLKNNKKGN